MNCRDESADTMVEPRKERVSYICWNGCTKAGRRNRPWVCTACWEKATPELRETIGHMSPHLPEYNCTQCGCGTILPTKICAYCVAEAQKQIDEAGALGNFDAVAMLEDEAPSLRNPLGSLVSKEEQLKSANAKSPGLKFDTGKEPLELLSRVWLLGVAKVLAFGAKKYAAHNWRKGMQYSRLLGAAQRHILAFQDGENVDPETGLSHLYHASCCLMFLAELSERQPEWDDRYKKEKENAENVLR